MTSYLTEMNSEQVLLEKARQFEEHALVAIYDEFSPGIYRYAIRQLGDEHLAEECVADTFSRFLAALKGGKGPNQYLRAYLYRIAHNWITDCYRRRPPPDLPLDSELHADPFTEPAQIVAEGMRQQEVRAALAQLTEEQRQVVVLKYLENWSNEEIAGVLEKPVGAVKALQHRGVRALRRILLKEEEIR